ncbi:MAG: RdgB/HAM1 family non-canonical purine NTP pyrophosphatase [Dehalococcoidia bacterium]|nr:RdgB/HAM1 family non-canonical purine NTP pyrophosphatase [Dehalococcoidia bacterium]
MLAAVEPLRLLAATSNAHKRAELRRLLSGALIDLASPSEAGVVLHVEETGTTYAENALLKARAYAKASGILALADDSGIEVDALGGKPGVRSARYGGPGLDDAARTRLLLSETAAIPDRRRGARYVAVLALAWPDGTAEAFTGTCEGALAREPRGANGFGYDPLFAPAGGGGRTMAELTAAEKDAVSHRGIAARKAAARLRELASEAPA